MDFELSEEQRQLADSVGRYLNEQYDFERRKKVLHSDRGASEAVWSQLAELGVLSIPFSESAGGFGGGAVDMMSAMQAIGAALVVEPVLGTVLAGRLIDRAGSASQRAEILPQVVDGSHTLAFAHTEDGSRYRLSQVATTATRSGDGWVLSGLKRVVEGAPLADLMVVSARTSGAPGDAQGVSLFVVAAGTKGVSMTPYRTIDNHRAADVKFDGVQVRGDALIGADGAALPVIEEAVDFATALLCAESVGAMQFANDTTLEYLKTRKQFGQPIGAFQALQHRMVEMFVTTEQARSMSYLVCSKVDSATDPDERARIVSAAKIKIADACRQISQESIQLHGGMGMTEEMKVSHTFRRLTMIAQQFGDADHHLDRFAALEG
ncbi:MAG: acyl-CoA dehydrogenase family protein [Burkholderiaceae bacterium]